jgi:hypothetical protein
MKKPILLLLSLIVVITAFVSSCKKEYSASGTLKPPVEDSFNLTVNFTPMVDTLKLHFDSTYRNFWKESYSISSFKFYTSKFDLINTDSNRTYHLNTNKYFLIDAADSTTWTVHLLATPFTYNRISFLIGIDSLRNVSGLDTGSLDPKKGMYISATGGFIMAELEGKSASGKSLSYEISGFSGDYNVLRTPTLLFPYNNFLQITPGRKSVINIEADANAWFSNPHQIKIDDIPTCTTPGLQAKDISENYSKMFTVDTVINN